MRPRPTSWRSSPTSPSYPQWVAAAKKVEVLETGTDGRARRVHFVLDAGAVKDDYVLDYTWDGDRKVSWTLVKGQMQKRQEGSYTLTETGRRHRGHVLDHHRPLHPDARDDQAQGREGHPGHGSQGAQEARRGLTRPVRTLLLTGPGGAGTTTLAAGRRGPCRPLGAEHRAADPAGRAGRRAGRRARSRRASVVDPQARRRAALGRRRPTPSAPSLPQLTLPPASSVVPLPGAADLALFAELARRPRPTWWSSTPVRSRSAPRCVGPARDAALVAGPAACRPACARWAPSARPRSPPASAPRGPRRRRARRRAGGGGAARRATAWPTRPDTAVCLVALPRASSAPALRAAATALGLHGLRAGAVLSRVLPLDGHGRVGDAARRRAGRPCSPPSPRWRRCTASPSAPSRPRTSTRWPGLLDGFALPDGRRPRPRRPSGTTAAGSSTAPAALRRARRVAPDPLGRRPGGHRRRCPPVAAAGPAAAPLRGHRRPARRPRHAPTPASWSASAPTRSSGPPTCSPPRRRTS